MVPEMICSVEPVDRAVAGVPGMDMPGMDDSQEGKSGRSLSLSMTAPYPSTELQNSRHLGLSHFGQYSIPCRRKAKGTSHPTQLECTGGPHLGAAQGRQA